MERARRLRKSRPLHRDSFELRIVLSRVRPADINFPRRSSRAERSYFMVMRVAVFPRAAALSFRFPGWQVPIKIQRRAKKEQSRSNIFIFIGASRSRAAIPARASTRVSLERGRERGGVPRR